MYWQKKYWFFTTPVNKIMSRNRYLAIRRFFHLCDESTMPPKNSETFDKLYKLRPFLEKLLPKFTRVYMPNKNIAIDESMIPFKGRISFRQFMPVKRVRFGIKCFLLAETATGYVSRISIYTGKDPVASDSNLGVINSLVLNLLAPFLHLGHHVYFDNYYSSAFLFKELYLKKTYACGTARTNRGIPEELIIARGTARGFSDWRVSGPLLAQCWVDSKHVYFFSTIHDPDYDIGDEGKTAVKRRGKKGQEPIEVPCPPLLSSYNKNMGGVDRSDQVRKYYNVFRKTQDWTRKVFCYLLEISIENSRIVANDLAGRDERSKEYRMQLVQSLIGSYRGTYQKVTESGDNDEIRLNREVHHFPQSVKHSKARCIVCTMRKSKGLIAIVHKSNIKCVGCNVHLCIEIDRDCFRHYHLDQNFWNW